MCTPSQRPHHQSKPRAAAPCQYFGEFAMNVMLESMLWITISTSATFNYRESKREHRKCRPDSVCTRLCRELHYQATKPLKEFLSIAVYERWCTDPYENWNRYSGSYDIQPVKWRCLDDILDIIERTTTATGPTKMMAKDLVRRTLVGAMALEVTFPH